MPTVNFNTHLPGYVVLAELGRGNTRVLKARHEASGDIVAIKQYAFAADADTLRRFERESQIMTQINHPNIVRVRDVQLGAAMPYVVMDFVEGGDLRSLLRQGPMDVLTTTRLGLQVMGALRTIHNLRVVHRDIKPENVLYRELISGELHFLLTDFGIAKLRADESSRTRTGQSLMTYEYAAPEQFDNPRQVDEAADYYALGVVLYESLTGRVPFVLQNETGLAQFMQQVLTAPLPALDVPLPPSLTLLVKSLLTRDPQQRLCDPDRVELLLEQSRVEYRRARPTDQPAFDQPRTQTLPGPVGTIRAKATVVDEPLDEAHAPDSGSQWAWLGALIVAAGLGYGLYTYIQRPNPANTAVTPVDSTLIYPAPTDTASDVEADTTAEGETSSEPAPEGTSDLEPLPPVVQTPSDSTERTTTVTDSASTAPPDSAQQ